MADWVFKFHARVNLTAMAYEIFRKRLSTTTRLMSRLNRRHLPGGHVPPPIPVLPPQWCDLARLRVAGRLFFEIEVVVSVVA